jgi:hypothetical protein
MFLYSDVVDVEHSSARATCVSGGIQIQLFNGTGCSGIPAEDSYVFGAGCSSIQDGTALKSIKVVGCNLSG